MFCFNFYFFFIRFFYYNFDNFFIFFGYYVFKIFGGDFVVCRNFGIVGFVNELERKDILFFEVGFVNMGKWMGEDKIVVVEFGLESGVFLSGIFIV